MYYLSYLYIFISWNLKFCDNCRCADQTYFGLESGRIVTIRAKVAWVVVGGVTNSNLSKCVVGMSATNDICISLEEFSGVSIFHQWAARRVRTSPPKQGCSWHCQAHRLVCKIASLHRDHWHHAYCYRNFWRSRVTVLLQSVSKLWLKQWIRHFLTSNCLEKINTVSELFFPFRQWAHLSKSTKKIFLWSHSHYFDV